MLGVSFMLIVLSGRRMYVLFVNVKMGRLFVLWKFVFLLFVLFL